MKRIALLLLASCTLLDASAQISITTSSLLYRQSFDGLDTISATPFGTTLPTGWSIFEYQGTGSTGARVDQKYAADFGASNTGDTYSYGSNGSNERALGALGSGSITSSFGARFVNNTGAPITGFAIQFRGEQWRMGATGRTNTDSLRFFYSTTASGVSDTTSAYTENTALMLNTPNMSATAGPLDGNMSGNFTSKSGVVAVTVPVGGSLVIKWIDRNIGGNDDGLAIDSVQMLFSTGPLSNPLIVGVTPAPGATGVAAGSNLTVTFSKSVTKSVVGNIYIKNRTDQTTNTIAASSTNVSVSGKVATITGAGLVSGKVYHVTFDSTVFDSAGYRSTGIYDTTIWRFNTIPAGIANMGMNASLPVSIINPSSNGEFQIVCSMSQAAVLTARVYDVSGRELLSRTFNAAKGDNRLQIHTSLPAGKYIIRVDDGKEWGSVKTTMQ